MTRNEVLEAYNVNADGMIVSPGKFEGEPVYAPSFYDALCDGGADEDIDGVALFKVTSEDRAEWPELDPDTIVVALEESDQGFVYASELTESAYGKLIDELATAETSDSD